MHSQSPNITLMAREDVICSIVKINNEILEIMENGGVDVGGGLDSSKHSV